MSTNKTSFLNLNDWIGSDQFRRDELNDNFRKLDAKAQEHSSQLAESTTEGVHYVTTLKLVDINVPAARDYTINNTALIAYVNAHPNVELYFPDGKYHLQSGLTFLYGVSLRLHRNAEIIADNAMDIMFCFSNYQTPSTIDSHMLFQHITGGKFNGNDKANKIIVLDSEMETFVLDTVIMNGLQRGLVSNQPHAELMMNNVYFRNKNQLTGATDNVTDNVAIEINSTDNYISNVNIVDWTVGVRASKPGNYLDKIHVWNSHSARIPLSIAFHVTSTGWLKLHYCVSDTCQTAFKNDAVMILDHCHILNNSFFSASFSGTPTGINNTGTYTQCQVKNVIFDGGGLGLNCFATSSPITGIVQDNTYWGTLYNKPSEIVSTSINTFTPTIAGTTTAGTPTTYTTQFGQYTKVGRMVMFKCNIKATLDATISGNLVIKGLPLTSVSGQTAVSIGYRNGFTDQVVTGTIDSASTQISLYKISSASPPVIAPVWADGLQTKTVEIWISGTYMS